MTLVAIALAGAAGAPARYLVERAVTARAHPAFPWGTWLVNVSGSLALGLVTGLGLYHGLGTDARLVAGVGFLGSYTTFSTFVFEAAELPRKPGAARPVTYIGTSIVAGLAAAAAGLGLAAAL